MTRLTEVRRRKGRGRDGRIFEQRLNLPRHNAPLGKKALPPRSHTLVDVVQAVLAQRSVITDYYELGEMLGEGGYGTVHMATRKKHDAGKAAASATTPSAALATTARVPGRGDQSGDVSGREEGEGGVYVAIKKVRGVLSDVAVRFGFGHAFAYYSLLLLRRLGGTLRFRRYPISSTSTSTLSRLARTGVTGRMTKRNTRYYF